MLRRIVCPMLLAASLSGCSYEYKVLAITSGANIVFIVDPKSGKQPSCLRHVEVIAEGDMRARPEASDDASRVGYGTFWHESVGYDEACANEFPLRYGLTLKGTHQQDQGIVKAKPLLRETVYSVSTTTGATGYGGGRFVVHADGRIENLGPSENAARM